MSPDVIVPVLALILPASIVFIHKHFRYKEKLLELQARGGSPPLLPATASAPVDERLLALQERVQNLESIIVAMDSELGSRASREELRRLGGPAPALGTAPTALTPRLAAAKIAP